ncbi:hypothetical protein Acr_20g0002010 [Actinidia rufa]|uniref:Uncharacterized protein n=1 Tax=Actinidia rufa TaxID=165716 RepID=A0A7J0GC77_9ERIC|nr:hypothetical protein Acr_20g0002010 [Actinidia rufa]
MCFWSEKLFSNFKRKKFVLCSYFKACELWDVVGEEPSSVLPRGIREKKEEKTLGVMKKAIHPEISKDIGETRSPSKVWKMLDFIASNGG